MTWKEASTILILLKLILIFSILVLRAIGRTSSVLLVHWTLRVTSSQSQPLGQNPRAGWAAVRARMKSNICCFILIWPLLFSSLSSWQLIKTCPTQSNVPSRPVMWHHTCHTRWTQVIGLWYSSTFYCFSRITDFSFFPRLLMLLYIT